MAKVDDLDLKLLSELKKDGSISIPLLAKKLNIKCICFIQSNKETYKKER